VRHELAHGGQHIAAPVWGACLQCEPLVDDQGLVLEQGVKTCQGRGRQRAATGHQGCERVEPVRHVAGHLEALVGFAGPDFVTRALGGDAQHVQRQAAERAAAGGDGVGAVAAGVLVLLPGPFPVGLQRDGQLLAHGFAHGVDALGVHHVLLLGDVGFGRQGEHQFLECGIQRGVAQHGAHGVHKLCGQDLMLKSAATACL